MDPDKPDRTMERPDKKQNIERGNNSMAEDDDIIIVEDDEHYGIINGILDNPVIKTLLCILLLLIIILVVTETYQILKPNPSTYAPLDTYNYTVYYNNLGVTGVSTTYNGNTYDTYQKYDDSSGHPVYSMTGPTGIIYLADFSTGPSFSFARKNYYVTPRYPMYDAEIMESWIGLFHLPINHTASTVTPPWLDTTKIVVYPTRGIAITDNTVWTMENNQWTPINPTDNTRWNIVQKQYYNPESNIFL
jgi:hypothetical protein